jgi:hypothetical protein
LVTLTPAAEPITMAPGAIPARSVSQAPGPFRTLALAAGAPQPRAPAVCSTARLLTLTFAASVRDSHPCHCFLIKDQNH